MWVGQRPHRGGGRTGLPFLSWAVFLGETTSGLRGGGSCPAQKSKPWKFRGGGKPSPSRPQFERVGGRGGNPISLMRRGTRIAYIRGSPGLVFGGPNNNKKIGTPVSKEVLSRPGATSDFPLRGSSKFAQFPKNGKGAWARCKNFTGLRGNIRKENNLGEMAWEKKNKKKQWGTWGHEIFPSLPRDGARGGGKNLFGFPQQGGHSEQQARGDIPPHFFRTGGQKGRSAEFGGEFALDGPKGGGPGGPRWGTWGQGGLLRQPRPPGGGLADRLDNTMVLLGRGTRFWVLRRTWRLERGSRGAETGTHPGP